MICALLSINFSPISLHHHPLTAIAELDDYRLSDLVGFLQLLLLLLLLMLSLWLLFICLMLATEADTSMIR